MTDGLACTSNMPLAWQVASVDENARQLLLREATLILMALNQMEGVHELEGGSGENRRLDRIEAKLDLALHLLARTLEPGPAPASRAVTLTPLGSEWPDAAPPAEGLALILELRPSEHLPLTLKLPAIAQAPRDGKARVHFGSLPEALDDALHQLVFRRHRQAIRSRSA